MSQATAFHAHAVVSAKFVDKSAPKALIAARIGLIGFESLPGLDTVRAG